jgi:predicted phage terminase large subunit-like protein
MSQERILDWDELSPQGKAATKMLCENSFLAFHRAFFAMTQGEKWQVNWHHKYLAHKIEEMIKGDMRAKSLIISVPPGAGKTEIFSIHAPAWSHIACRKLRNLHISFSDSLTRRNSMRAKHVLKSNPFQEMWPCNFGTDQADEWQVLNDKEKVITEIVARSMGGQITGGRGGFPGPGYTGGVWLDDPDKPADMFSAVKRSKNHDTLVNTLRSRRANKSKDNPTPFGIIQQRLHVHDTTGFILAGGMGKNFNFEHIKIPALINQEYIDSLPEWIRQDCIDDICHTEQINGYWSFWPSNEDISQLMDLWDANEYTFMSQYMQEPISIGGNLFKSEWWKFYGEDADLPRPPTFKYRFITADTAQKIKEHNDYSVFCEWGYWDGKVYLINIMRGKWEAPQLRKMFKGFVMESHKRNGPTNGNLRKVIVEDKSSGTGLIQDLAGELPINITGIPRSVDKLTRAMDAQPHVEAGNVVLPVNHKLMTAFVSEHSAFTADDTHAHDDMVDNTFDAINHALISNSGSIGIDMMKRKRT